MIVVRLARTAASLMLAVHLGAAVAASADPVKVAYALEGLNYAGPSGPSWMRAEDHQMIAPLYILSFVKAGGPGVRYDEEKTGYGWRTDAFIDAKDMVPPVRCRMERPAN